MSTKGRWSRVRVLEEIYSQARLFINVFPEFYQTGGGVGVVEEGEEGVGEGGGGGGA